MSSSFYCFGQEPVSSRPHLSCAIQGQEGRPLRCVFPLYFVILPHETSRRFKCCGPPDECSQICQSLLLLWFMANPALLISSTNYVMQLKRLSKQDATKLTGAGIHPLCILIKSILITTRFSPVPVFLCRAYSNETFVPRSSLNIWHQDIFHPYFRSHKLLNRRMLQQPTWSCTEESKYWYNLIVNSTHFSQNYCNGADFSLLHNMTNNLYSIVRMYRFISHRLPSQRVW
jgi:hypothetical protein